MRKAVCALALILSFFSLPRSASADAARVAVEFGPWSEWSEREPSAADEQEVDIRLRTVEETIHGYGYRRYLYYSVGADEWRTAATPDVGEDCREGSGSWESVLSKDKKPDDGAQDGQARYEGGWFFEQRVDWQEMIDIAQYRTRTVRYVACELSDDQLYLLPGQQQALTADLLDQIGAYQWDSNNEEVATVDAQGVVTAVGVGFTQVNVRSEKSGRLASCTVFVGQKNARVADGLYTLRLADGGLALNMPTKKFKKNVTKVNLVEYDGSVWQQFYLKNVGGGAFTLHPVPAQGASLDVKYKGKYAAAGNGVRINKKPKKVGSYFQAIDCQDGTLVIHSKSNERALLSAAGEESGSALALKARGVLDQADRWVLVRQNTGTMLEHSYTLPVAPNGVSYIANEFDPRGESLHEGLDLGSNGRRVLALSITGGKVVQVKDGCPHDYPKSKNSSGQYADPCGKRGSYGKYVVVDHGGGLTTRYAHLSEVYVKEGQVIHEGTSVGLTGSTGASSSVHLHFELLVNKKAVDPRLHMTFPAKGQKIQ